jgi:hypothetical protein
MSGSSIGQCQANDFPSIRSALLQHFKFVFLRYCNGRIMKFSPEGGLMKVWGKPSLRGSMAKDIHS